MNDFKVFLNNIFHTINKKSNTIINNINIISRFSNYNFYYDYNFSAAEILTKGDVSKGDG